MIEINKRSEDKYLIMYLEGELDASSAIDLDSAIEQATQERQIYMLFDCTNLDYISSPGIGVFTSRIDDVHNNALFFALFGLKPNVLEVFKVLGIDQLLPIAADKDAAKILTNGLQQKNNM